MRAALAARTTRRKQPLRALPVVDGDNPAAAQAFATKSKADETVRAYRHDFVTFETFCAANGHPSMPATPAAASAFLASEQARACKAATLTRRVASIRYRHKLNRHLSPTDDEGVRAVLSGIKRVIGTEQTPKTAATADLVSKMLATSDGTLTGKRDRALIAVGFAGAFRRAERCAAASKMPMHLTTTRGRIFCEKARHPLQQRGLTQCASNSIKIAMLS